MQADLERSGQFRAIDAAGAGASTKAAGPTSRRGGRKAPIRWRWAASRGWPTAATTCASACGTWCAAQDLGGQSYAVAAGDLRLAAHRIADFIYEKLTGEKGVFSTRIAYVTKAGSRYNLWVADADGENAQSALASSEPIISPAWSANGAQLAYVSFESRKPVVYVHDVATGKRRLIANFRGSNSAPAWSPDGRTLAVTLSRDGGSQLYTIDANGGEPRRLTQSSGIDTEPLYLARRPQHLLRQRPRRRAADLPHAVQRRQPGARHLYGELQHLAGPQPRRTLAGLHFPHQRRLQTAGDGTRAAATVHSITDTTADESPSFAPNGRLIVYATRQNGPRSADDHHAGRQDQGAPGGPGRRHPRAGLGSVPEMNITLQEELG